MALWFDASEDTALLHESVRTHTEIAAVALEAEDDVTHYFTTTGQPTLEDRIPGATQPYWFIENGVAYTVELYGYAPDPEDAAGFDATRANWTGFAKAFRQTIADVTSHRLRHYDELYDLRSESHGRESWSYRDSRELRWPPNWRHHLRRYSTKAPAML